jgi:hypothetical protein
LFQLEQEYDSDQDKRKRKGDESDASDEDDDDDDDDRPKKRGRPGRGGKEKIRGFNDSELRRFIKSYKKFVQPLARSVGFALFLFLFVYFICIQMAGRDACKIF